MHSLACSNAGTSPRHRYNPEVAVTTRYETIIGIEPDLLRRIFDPFQQGEASITRKFGGMGLGLAISKGIIEGHEGRLSASAGAEGGAVFQFALPGDAEGVRVRGSR